MFLVVVGGGLLYDFEGLSLWTLSWGGLLNGFIEFVSSAAGVSPYFVGGVYPPTPACKGERALRRVFGTRTTTTTTTTTTFKTMVSSAFSRKIVRKL